MLRLVRPRDESRPADVHVDPSTKPCPATTRSHGAPSLASGDIDIDASELIFESLDVDDPEKTPVTRHSDWQRNVPPPLPGTES